MESGFILRKKVLETLAHEMKAVANDYFNGKEIDEAYHFTLQKSRQANAWFTESNQMNALNSAADLILSEQSQAEILKYAERFDSIVPKKIAVIPAGNIPAVGFADMVAIYLSGHIYYAKVSSSDPYWLVFLGERLKELAPEFNHLIQFEAHLLKDFDAAIATGSNNSARYFDQYFGKYPNIIRKNRSSIAVLNGNESEEELMALLEDMFQYFGLGCRNVSFLMVPINYDFTALLRLGEEFKSLHESSKFTNNYDYYKSISLLNKEHFLDNGIFMVKEADRLGAPISVIHFKYFESLKDVEVFLENENEGIQCVVSKENIAFDRKVDLGIAQNPSLGDWPDGKNVFEFLTKLVN